MLSNGKGSSTERRIKLDQACAKATDKLVESAINRSHKEFDYWCRVLEILWKNPDLLWVDSKNDFLIQDIDKPDIYDSAVVVILYNSLE